MSACVRDGSRHRRHRCQTHRSFRTSWAGVSEGAVKAYVVTVGTEVPLIVGFLLGYPLLMAAHKRGLGLLAVYVMIDGITRISTSHVASFLSGRDCAPVYKVHRSVRRGGHDSRSGFPCHMGAVVPARICWL